MVQNFEGKAFRPSPFIFSQNECVMLWPHPFYFDFHRNRSVRENQSIENFLLYCIWSKLHKCLCVCLYVKCGHVWVCVKCGHMWVCVGGLKIKYVWLCLWFLDSNSEQITWTTRNAWNDSLRPASWSRLHSVFQYWHSWGRGIIMISVLCWSPRKSAMLFGLFVKSKTLN